MENTELKQARGFQEHIVSSKARLMAELDEKYSRLILLDFINFVRINSEDESLKNLDLEWVDAYLSKR